jgi:hypothetical protein
MMLCRYSCAYLHLEHVFLASRVYWCYLCTVVASEEKERYRNSRQGSRSRRRLLSGDSFRGEASGKGSSKGGKLANEDGRRRLAVCAMNVSWFWGMGSSALHKIAASALMPDSGCSIIYCYRTVTVYTGQHARDATVCELSARECPRC